jgi:uncharacterized protein YidB (DUF937 family)
MGLFDQIKDIAAKALGTNNDTMAIIGGVQDLLNKNGGVQGLVQKFEGKGLGEVAKSWVGTGANLPINKDQIMNALGSDTVKNLATKMGLPADAVQQKLAEHLPAIIDKLTPNGQIPTNISLDQVKSIATDLFTKKTS